MRPRTVIAAVGFVLVGLIILGLGLTLLIALRNHQPFYGRNVYGMPLGVYSSIAMLVVGGAIGVVSVAQRIRRRGGLRGGR
jgi:hypothetical protein